MYFREKKNHLRRKAQYEGMVSKEYSIVYKKQKVILKHWKQMVYKNKWVRLKLKHSRDLYYFKPWILLKNPVEISKVCIKRIKVQNIICNIVKGKC